MQTTRDMPIYTACPIPGMYLAVTQYNNRWSANILCDPRSDREPSPEKWIFLRGREGTTIDEALQCLLNMTSTLLYGNWPRFCRGPPGQCEVNTVDGWYWRAAEY